MLSDHCRRLLSAYVDGELSARQRKAVLRLLRRSTEARALLRALQEDAQRLRRLPRKRSDPEFQFRLIATFAEQQAELGRFRPPSPQPATIPLWLGLSAAAAMLIAVGIGSYLYFSGPTWSDPPVARQSQPAPAVPAARAESLPEHTPVPREEPPAGPRPAASSRPAPPELVRAPRPAPADEPDPDPEVLASPAPVEKKELFRAADVQLPIVINLHELDQEKSRQELRGELNRGSAFRLELPCRESSARAFKRLQPVLEANGIRLIVDQVAQVRLRYGQFKTNYVIYLEDVTPDELVRVLEQLGAEDRKAEAGPRQFTQLVAASLNEADRKEISQLLSVDPRQLTPRSQALPGVDLRKPLAETTGDQVAQALTKQGGVPRPEPGKPAAKAPERLALALAYNPVRPRSGSAEVKRFLESRKPPREGTLQVLLVLRDAG
ncbi:MAG TPA: zf-HC2 domain-containing protein [Gemmataceae bacterium]|nr:zf-HC2 domain-containing protein [Gemmataceae bacterium]